ncbi:MAG: M18 family aminopeptidase [Clostridioides sp.]|nr:M18 family aminopeptidase [Clostridioides sp.]
MSCSKELAKEIIDFIDESPTCYQAVNTAKEMLDENGFEELKLNGKWDIAVGGKYYVRKNLSAIIAFTVNSDELEENGFKIIGSHSDSPTFKIKPSPEIGMEKDTYLKLNTEPYGGAIMSTWMDRPLGIAGRVSITGDSVLKPVEKLIDFKKPMCIIPNMAIHMNRAINDGYKFNPQEDMIPLVGLINDKLEKENFLLNAMAEELNVKPEEIIDFDLFLYDFQKGCLMGYNEEFISVGRQDDLSMACTSLKALIESKGQKGVNIAAVFDNEEVGSATKQGAGSNMLLNLIERIAIALGKSREQFFEAMYSSFMISADLAHAVHPNKLGKHDPTTRPVMGKGPVIKMSARQAYTSDAFSAAVYKSICKKAGVEFQEFVNRSDEKGGSTIGPISSTHIDIPAVDIGTPVLAMHSVRELGHVDDYVGIFKSFTTFYEL